MSGERLADWLGGWCVRRFHIYRELRQRWMWRSLRRPTHFRCRSHHDHRYRLGAHGIGFAELTCARCGRHVSITCMSNCRCAEDAA